MGDEVFTRGRPHPMIDLRLRLSRLKQEANDPETAVILFDVVLGYGAHPNPAAEIAAAIASARRDDAANRLPIFVASVCGTDGDPQDLQQQESILKEAGVLVAPSNAAATRLAADRDRGAAKTDAAPPMSTLPQTLQVINVGVRSFAESIHAAGGLVTQVDWRPPADSDPIVGRTLAHLINHPANRSGEPTLHLMRSSRRSRCSAT